MLENDVEMLKLLQATLFTRCTYPLSYIELNKMMPKDLIYLQGIVLIKIAIA